MSGMFEQLAASDEEQQVQQREASNKLSAAIYDVKDRFGQFLFGAQDIEGFHDRLALCKNDVIKTVEPHLFPRTGVLRRVLKPIEREFRASLERQADGGWGGGTEHAPPAMPSQIQFAPGQDEGDLGNPMVGEGAGYSERGNITEHSSRRLQACGPYKSFDACVAANGDKDDPQAYCGSLEKKSSREVADDDPVDDRHATPQHVQWPTELHESRRQAADALGGDPGLAAEQGGAGLPGDPQTQMNFADADSQGLHASLHHAGFDDTDSIIHEFHQARDAYAQSGRPDDKEYLRQVHRAIVERAWNGDETAKAWIGGHAPHVSDPGRTMAGAHRQADGASTEGYASTNGESGYINPSGGGPTETVAPGDIGHGPSGNWVGASRRQAGDGDQKDLKTKVTYSPSDAELKPKGDFEGYLNKVDQGAHEKVQRNFANVQHQGQQDELAPVQPAAMTGAPGQPGGSSFGSPGSGAEYPVTSPFDVTGAIRQFVGWCKQNRIATTLTALDRYAPSDRVYFTIAAAIQRQATDFGMDAVSGDEGVLGEAAGNNMLDPGNPSVGGAIGADRVGSHREGTGYSDQMFGPGFENTQAGHGAHVGLPPGEVAQPKKLKKNKGNQPRVAPHNTEYQTQMGFGPVASRRTGDWHNRPHLNDYEDDSYSADWDPDSRGLDHPDSRQPTHAPPHGHPGPGGSWANRNASRQGANGSTGPMEPFGNEDAQGFGPADHGIMNAVGGGQMGEGWVGGGAHEGRRHRFAAPDHLQKADEALKNLLNQKASEFQEGIAPLQQALQIVQQAEAEQQAANPLNVIPPAGTVNVLPQSPAGGPQAPPPGVDASQGAPDQGGPPPAAADQGALPPDPGGGGVPPEMLQQLQAKFNSRERGGSGKVRGATRPRQAANVNDLWDRWNQDPNNVGIGGEADYDSFSQQFGVGPKALQKLKKQHLGPQSPMVAPPVAPRVGAAVLEAPPHLWSKDPSDTAHEFLTRVKNGEPPHSVYQNMLSEIEDHRHKGYLSPGEAHDAADQAFGGMMYHSKRKKTATRKKGWQGWARPRSAHRKVAGWDWDDHLAGYITTAASDFSCDCGNRFETPTGYRKCACGKTYNSYAIGSGDGREAALDKIICREIPVRPDVIVAKKAKAPAVLNDRWQQTKQGWAHPDGGVIRPSDENPGTYQLWGPTVTMNGRGGSLAKIKHPHPDPQHLKDWYSWASGEGPKPPGTSFFGSRTAADETLDEIIQRKLQHPNEVGKNTKPVDNSKMWNNFNELSGFRGAAYAGYDEDEEWPQNLPDAVRKFNETPRPYGDRPGGSHGMGWEARGMDDDQLGRAEFHHHGRVPNDPDPEYGHYDDYDSHSAENQPDEDDWPSDHHPDTPKIKSTPKDWHHRDKNQRWTKGSIHDITDVGLLGLGEEDGTPDIKSTPPDWHHRDKNQRWTK